MFVEFEGDTFRADWIDAVTIEGSTVYIYMGDSDFEYTFANGSVASMKKATLCSAWRKACCEKKQETPQNT